MNALIHARELELAARDYIHSQKPDYDLSMRVQNYTNWEGEINEIIHYSKTTARGIDVLINMVISDYIGDTKNIETIFNSNYKFFGVRVFNHDLYDYCCVVIYAEEIYSTLKSALYTSSNIDEELMFERETLGRKIAQNSNYHYSSRYAREHPEVHVQDYLNKAQKSKRKVRLTENADGERTFTVLRRDSLERNNEYTLHDDSDYQYVDRENERFTRVPIYGKKNQRNFNLGKGERIIRQRITDFDRELYSKNLIQGERVTKYDWNGDPHADRFTVPNWKDLDSQLYYGDINDITYREEDIVSAYPTVAPESCSGNHNHSVHCGKAVHQVVGDNPKTFRPSAYVPRKSVNQIRNIQKSQIVNDGFSSSHSSKSNYNKSPTNYDGIEVSYREEAVLGDENNGKYSSQLSEPNDYGRYSSNVSIAHAVQGPVEINGPHLVNNYRMTERESIRSSRGNRISVAPQVERNRISIVKGGKIIDDFSADKSYAGRPTSYSSVHKRRTGTRGGVRDFSPLNNFDPDSSF